ncbi:MAG: hypothetical protein ACREHG_10240 [Candidatus Saccharimonadales bacterium]
MADKSGNGDIALALLSIAEVPNFFSGLLPSLWTIGHFSASENKEAVYWIHRGEIIATGLSLAVGLATSIVAKDMLPLIGCAIMTATLLYLYEHALRNGSNATYE